MNRTEYRLHGDWCVVRSDSIGDAGRRCDCSADRINTLLRALTDLVLQEGRYILPSGKVDDVLAVVPKGALQRAREALVE